MQIGKIKVNVLSAERDQIYALITATFLLVLLMSNIWDKVTICHRTNLLDGALVQLR